MPTVPNDALSGLALSQATSSFRSDARQSDPAEHHHRRDADQRDRLEIVHHVVGDRIGQAREHMRVEMADAQRVAVGRRARDAADAERASRRR